MKHLFSFLKRKLFPISLLPVILLTGFVFTKDAPRDFTLNSLSLFPNLNVKNTKTYQIPFETKRVLDSNLKSGTEVIQQRGAFGTKEITYKKTYRSGSYFENSVHNINIVQEPITEIIKVGTGNSAIGGENCPFWFSIVDEITQDENERTILKTLIRCETRCNDSKNNKNKYLGLLQFSPKTFTSYGGSDIWDGRQQIFAALEILRRGGLNHHWPACSKNLN